MINFCHYDAMLCSDNNDLLLSEGGRGFKKRPTYCGSYLMSAPTDGTKNIEICRVNGCSIFFRWSKKIGLHFVFKREVYLLPPHLD